MITDWLDPVSYKLGQAAGGGGGGGNPNYVETITGDSENPWGTYTFTQLCALANSKAATFSLELVYYNDDSEENDIYRMYYTGSPVLMMGWREMTGSDPTSWQSDTVITSPNVAACRVTSAGHIRSIQPSVGAAISIPWQTLPAPTTLTIIHHTLP